MAWAAPGVQTQRHERHHVLDAPASQRAPGDGPGLGQRAPCHPHVCGPGPPSSSHLGAGRGRGHPASPGRGLGLRR